MTQENYIIALKKIRNALLLIFFSINLGTLDILPDWVAYILMYQSVIILGEEEKSALLLKNLFISLIGYYFIDWLFKIVGITLNIHIVTEIFMIIRLYANFQLMTHIIDISIAHQSKMSNKIKNVRNMMTIILTCLSLISYFGTNEIMQVIMIIALIVYFILIIKQILDLNSYIQEEKNRL